MEMGDFRLEDFASKFNQNWSRFDWLMEISRVYFSVERIHHRKSNDMNMMKKKESSVREKVLKKAMEAIIDEPKKHKQTIIRSSNDEEGPPTKLMHSAIDSMRNPNSLKRNRQKSNNFDDDFDWEYCKKKNDVVKKKGKAVSNYNKITTRTSESHRRELPEEFKREIERLNGTNVGLVIEKELTTTDLNYVTHNRMSMPLLQMVSSTSFLTKDEAEILEQKEGVLRVRLIDPNLVQRDINLKRWVMRKGEGSKKSSISYVLRTQWGDVVRANKEVIQAGNVVQVWSFRVNHELHLALVVVGNKGKKESDYIVDGESIQRGGVNEVVMQQAVAAAGGDNGNAASGGSSTLTTNGLELDLNASPSC